MATFPKPLCELKALWGDRGSRASRQARRPADVRTPVPTPPLAGQPERQTLSQVEEATKNREGE